MKDLAAASRRPARAVVASLATARSGEVIRLPDDQQHHLRRVRRAGEGVPVEIFDPHGRSASGRLTADGVLLETPVAEAVSTGLTVAAATPKGQRADWMVEKLGELEVSAWIPLRTERSVVDPRAGKLERWSRIAAEAAKQSRRVGILQVRPVATPEEVLSAAAGDVAVLTTEGADAPAATWLAGGGPRTVLVGPEGGWSAAELARFRQHGLARLRLGASVLKIETAAVAVAVLAGCVTTTQMHFASDGSRSMLAP